MANQSLYDYIREETRRLESGAQSSQQNQQIPQDARAAMNGRVSERNAQRRAEQLAGVQAKTAGYANGTNPTAAVSVNEGAGEEKPKSAGIDLSPKQNVTGNALYDQWREAMTGRLGKDFEARMNAAEAATDPKKLQDAYRTASDEYDKAKKAESAAKEKMKTAPSDAVAEQYREGYESAKAAREAAEAEFDRSKAQLESAGVELPDTSTWGKIKHLFTGEGQRTTDGFTAEQAAQYKELLSRLDGIQAASAFALTTEQSDALEKERAETLSALHQMDADAGRAERAYDARDRAGAFFKSWGKGTAASYANTAGSMLDLADVAHQASSETQRRIADNPYAGYATDPLTDANFAAAPVSEETSGFLASQRKERDALYETADKLLTESEQQMAKAKQGTSAVAQFALDAAKTGMDIAADTAASAIGVPGLANMAVRVYGNESQQARLSGDDAQTAAAKGVKAAIIEVLTEKISGPFEKAYGSSLGKAAAATKVGKAVNAAVDKLKSSGLIRLAMGAAGEGFEEGMSDVLNTVADHVAGWDDGTGTIWDDIKGDKEQILYDMLLGAFVGTFGGAGNLARGNANATAEAAPTQQTAAEVQSAAPTQQAAPAASAESRASSEAETMPQDSAQQPQTRTEAQGGNPAPAEAENVKQAGSDALNSALNLNNVETQAEAPAQAQKNTAPTQQKVNIDNTASPAYNDTSKIMGGVSGVAGTGIAADSNGVPGIHQGSDTVYRREEESRRAAVSSGLVLLNDKSQATLRERGVAVEAKDASADKAAFSAALASARESDAEHGWAVTPKSAQELAESGAKLITTQNGAAGLGVAKDGDIEAVYSNKAAGAPKGVTKSLIPIAIANGGTKLDCYGDGLVTLYSQYGFVPVAKVKFNPEYANPGWDASKGTPDIYFMMHNGDSADAVVAKEGTYSIPTKAELDALPTMDYDEAYSYRDSLIQEGKRAGSAGSAPTTAQNVKSENQENAGGAQGRPRSDQRVLEDSEGSPKEKERGFSKNVRTDNAMEPKIRESFDTAPETYEQLANKDTLAKAEEIFARGLDEARGEVEQALGAAKSGSKLAPEMVPLARMVANELSKNGDVETARRILADVATELTAAGQLGQAGRILRDSDPNTALASIQKSIDAINAEFEKQHKRSKWRAELTEAETQEILSTDFTESGAYERIYEKVATRLGKEMPSSVLEKLTEIRRINMLLRPRTQIKNFVSNVPMVGLRKGAEALSIGIQSALTKTGRMKEADRTRGWASNEQRQLARTYYEANKADINGQSNKWDLKSMLREKRTIFKGGAIEKAVSKMTGKEIDSFGEALRQVTYSCLEKGDAPFVKSAFVDSLSQYCAAKGITTEAGITQEAIDFATANAMEATFKNANVIADIVNRAKRNSSPAVSAAIDVLIPFTTTPANILSLMGDYSPVGFAKLVSTDGPAARIDVISKASVGSAMLALGVALRFAGIITGGEDDDKDKAALDKATGQSTYSIGGRVSYDWAQPAGSLLAFGAEIADAVKGQEGWDSALMNAIYTAGDSALNLSLFQNIISLLRGSGKPTQQIIDAIMEGGATQLVPGLAGDIAKIIDGTVRSTYTGGNVFNDIGAKVLSTTPGFSKKLPASVNVRGEENTRGGLAARTFNMLLNPTNYTGGKRNAVDEEIYRLYDATGGTSFFPSVSPYKIEYDNKLYTMNGKDRETFQKAQGQTYYELAKPLLDSEMYKALSDEQKADVLKSIRDYALDAAKRQFVDGRGGEYSNDSWDAISALSKAGISEYLPAAQALKDGKDGTGGSATYDAIDLLLGKYGDLSAPVRDELERKGLNVPGLRYSHALGMGAEDWYSAHEAVAEGEKTLGGADAAKAISIYNSMEGKSDEEILNAMRAQLMPKSDSGGKQNATVRRAEAYMTAAKNNGAEGNLGEWLTLTAELKDADENDHVSKDDVEKAWTNMGLGAKETYAGITLNDFYNITKSGTKSYANNPDYATQIDKIYAELYPDAPSVKAQLSGSVRTSERADDGGKTASGVPRNRDAAADWVMKHSRAAKRRIS